MFLQNCEDSEKGLEKGVSEEDMVNTLRTYTINS